LVHNKNAVGRQSMQTFYEYNGAIYVINVKSLKEKGLASFTRKVKYIMPKESSIDIDDIYDFMLAEQIIQLNNR
jgi:N-acylneuraminate cytidylyltransferase